ncbi:MAG: GYD domain-containing protein [Bacteroidota bacterium]
MTFITLVKFRRRPTADEVNSAPQKLQQAGLKIVSSYWTLGRYDAVVALEAPDEKSVMKAMGGLMEPASTETLVAIPRAEALKLVGY